MSGKTEDFKTSSTRHEPEFSANKTQLKNKNFCKRRKSEKQKISSDQTTSTNAAFVHV